MLKNFVGIVVLVVTLALGSFYAIENSSVTVVILHTNDIHGQLYPFQVHTSATSGELKRRGGFLELASLIKSERESAKSRGYHPLLIDTGDWFQGTPEGNLTKGSIMTLLMNAVGYDIVVPGNHEFDFGAEEMVLRLNELDSDILCCNLFLSIDKDYHDRVKPYVLVERDGIKIAFVGVLLDNKSRVMSPESLGSLIIGNPIESTERIVSSLRSRQDVDYIVLLSHCGIEDDVVFAEEIEGIDLIIGGHSHTYMEKPVYSEGGVPIVHAWAKAGVLGKVTLRFNRFFHSFAGFEWAMLPVDPEVLQPDAVIVSFADQMSKDFPVDLARVIGHNNQSLFHSESKYRSDIGRWLCQIMREATGADIAFHNRGGIRADLMKGPVTVRDMFLVSPFDNSLVTMRLTGEQLFEILKRSFQMPYLGLDYVGVEVPWEELDFSEEGSTVQLSFDTLQTSDGRKLDKTKRYRIVTNSFIAGGGDGFSQFAAGDEREATSLFLRDLQIRWFEKNGALDIRAIPFGK